MLDVAKCEAVKRFVIGRAEAEVGWVVGLWIEVLGAGGIDSRELGSANGIDGASVQAVKELRSRGFGVFGSTSRTCESGAVVELAVGGATSLIAVGWLIQLLRNASGDVGFAVHVLAKPNDRAPCW